MSRGHVIVARLIRAGHVELAIELHEVLGLKRIPLKPVKDMAENNEGRDMGTKGEWHVFWFDKPKLADIFQKSIEKIGKFIYTQRMGSHMVGLPDALLVR